MSGARKYLPITPRLAPLAHAVRSIMWPPRMVVSDAIALALSPSAAQRIHATMKADELADAVRARGADVDVVIA